MAHMKLEKKIQFGGWNKRSFSEIRNKVKALALGEERILRFKKKEHIHRWVLVKPNEESYPSSKAQSMANLFRPKPENNWRPKGFPVFECEKCHKIDVRYKEYGSLY